LAVINVHNFLASLLET